MKDIYGGLIHIILEYLEPFLYLSFSFIISCLIALKLKFNKNDLIKNNPKILNFTNNKEILFYYLILIKFFIKLNNAFFLYN